MALNLVTGGLLGYSDLVTGGLGQGTSTSYPIARFDFETGGTLASEGLTDIDSVFGIETTHAYTGTHGVSASGTGNHDLITTAADTLSGNLTVTGYFYPTATNGFTLYSNMQPFGTAGNTFVQATFGPNGLTVGQDISGTYTQLSASGSGVSIPTGVWLGMELRINGTAVSARLWNTSTGNFFQNATGGAGSWVSSVQQVSVTLSGFPTGGGSFGPRIAAGNTIYFDDLIEDAPAPVISISAFSIATSAGTYQLTAGGFTDPLLTNPGGVTWSSGTPSIATVGATTGLVTAVANGSATITATGIRDSSQTATSTATITNQATINPTTATLSGPMTGVRSTASANFTITLNQPATASVSCVITSSVGGDTITSTPVVIGIGSSTGTFTVTPSTNAARTITLTSATTTSTPNSLTCTGAIVYTTSTAVKTITLDNAAGPAATSQVVFIPLSVADFPFVSIASNGQDLGVIASDGVTLVPCSLRDWGGVGLRYDAASSFFNPASSNGHDYIFSTGPSVGTLGTANDPHTIVGTGNPIGESGLGWGQWDLYDSQGSHVWRFASPSQDFSMSMAIGDISGSGDYVIAVGAGTQDHAGYILNPDGSTRWSAVFTANGQANAPYIRTSAIGKISNSYTGAQVVFGGEYGQLSCFTSTGATVWGPLTLVPAYGASLSVQAGFIADLTGGGTKYFYGVQGTTIFQINGAGTVNWTFASPLASSGFQFNYFSLAYGYITSLASQQIVAATAPDSGTADTEQSGIVTVVDHTGTVQWQKVYPFRLGSVCVGDVNGDGYGEVIAGWTNLQSYSVPTNGGILVLDRFGNELACGSLSAGSSSACFGTYDGSPTPAFSLATNDRRLVRYKVDISTGASVKAVVPSVTAASTTQQLVLAAIDNATYLPALGDFPFITTGTNGSTPVWGTQYGTSGWTIQSSTVQTPALGDTLTAFLEATGVSTDGLELEFAAQQVAQSASPTYVACAYRCNTWATGYANCVEFRHSASGSCSCLQLASGSGSVVETLFTTAASGLTFTTTDVIKFRVVATGLNHSASYSKNGGPWTILYWLLDPSGTPLTSAGTVAISGVRGQTQFSSIVLRAITSAYSSTSSLAGPAPIPVLSLLAPTTYPAAMMLGL